MKIVSPIFLCSLLSLTAIWNANAADIVVSTNTSGSIACCIPLIAATENNQGITVNSGVTVTNNGFYGIAIGTFSTPYENTTITNNGKLVGGYGIVNQVASSQDSINNTSTGIINATDYGIFTSTTTTLTNAGQITGGVNGIYIDTGTIGTITNTGTIVGTADTSILNYGTITTLNNAQGAGNSAGALTIQMNLPTNYNIILGGNAATYGKLDKQGAGLNTLANFGIYGGTVSSRIYTGVLSGITAVTAGTTGTYSGQTYQLVLESGSINIWNLLFPNWSIGPNAANTLATVQQNASALSGTYNVQASALQAGLTYDCNTFDKYGLCASVGGRATYGLTAPSGNQQAGLVVVSHKPDSHFRYGGFADQSVATASPNGIKYNNSGPMFGFFGYWNHQKDNMGWGASVTTAFSNSNLTVTRNASLANTEAGSGNTEMQGQAVQAQATYAMQATTRIKAQPYLGLRYYRVATGGYSEGSNADVTSPLTYNAMAQEVFAAVGGLGTSVFLAEKLTGNASVGIQQNLNYKMGNYQGTSSISGLESFSVSMPSNINSMATATAGVTYAIKKNEKLSLNALWQQQAFSATNTITALATYSIGF